MATVTENEATGRALRVLRSIDAAGNSSWYKISLWSRASDTFFSDNKTAQTKLGAINGITSDINGTATDIAASINVVNNTKTSLTTSITNVSNVANAANVRSTNNETYMGGCRFFYENGKYYIQAGADTGTKKPLGSGLDGMKKLVYESFYGGYNNPPRVSKTIQKDGNWIVYRENIQAPRDDGTTALLTEMFKTEGMWYGNAYNDENGRVPTTYPYDPYHNYYYDNSHQHHTFANYVFDLKRFFPNEYQDWTADNFFFVPKIVDSNCDHEPSNNIGHPPKFGIVKKYNATTGKLTIGPLNAYWSENWGASDPENTNSGHHGLSFPAWELIIIS